MKVNRPSKNAITGGYSTSHPAYDFSGKGDLNVYASNSGTVVISKDKYVTNWRQGKDGDPTPWGLTTEDYGNFIKLRHADGSSSLYGHLQHGTPLQLNTQVKEGQVIGKIGNTGNSTGRHLHYEFRDANGTNQKVEFKEDSPTGQEDQTMSTELEKQLAWYQKEYPLEQQRLIEARKERDDFEKEVKFQKELLKIEKQKHQDEEEELRLVVKEQKEELEHFSDVLGTTRDWGVRRAKLEAIVTEAGRFDSEVKAHTKTKEILSERDKTISQMNIRIKELEAQAKEAKGLLDATDDELMREWLSRKLESIKSRRDELINIVRGNK